MQSLGFSPIPHVKLLGALTLVLGELSATVNNCILMTYEIITVSMGYSIFHVPFEM